MRTATEVQRNEEFVKIAYPTPPSPDARYTVTYRNANSWALVSDQTQVPGSFQRVLVSYPRATSWTSSRTSSLRCLFHAWRPVAGARAKRVRPRRTSTQDAVPKDLQ